MQQKIYLFSINDRIIGLDWNKNEWREYGCRKTGKDMRAEKCR
jgi:hypothetical protein